MIPDDKVAEVRDRIDLLALIREYVEIRRAGTAHKGLCPFHSEKSPSFHVHPDRGFFHCFGCQASGDAISFLMRIDGHSFPEAVRALAERCGVEIEEQDSEQERASRQRKARRERLLSIVESAAGFFVQMLAEHRFKEMAWDELRRREIDEKTVATYRLGYAPHGWDGLSNHLAKKGFSPIECEEVGLTVPRKSGQGSYDRFRHRLMFPVSDAHGKIVAFSGRALAAVPGDEGGDSPAKYVNSPETPLYTKGEILFGLHEARVALRRSEMALVVEGNFDVVALAQHGFENVVAPLGTAFTVTQAKRLRRYAQTAVLLFDADAAGRKAARAAQPLLAQVGIAGKVVTLPPGEDPDSYLRSQGAEAMQRLIGGAPNIVEWLIESAALQAGADPRARADAIEELGPVLAALDNPVEVRLYIDRVAKAFAIPDVQVVRQQLRRGVRSNRPRRRRPEAASPPATTESAPARAVSAPLPEEEARLVGAYLDQPGLHESADAQKVQALLTHADLRAIFSATARWARARGLDALLEGVDEHSSARAWLAQRMVVQQFEDEASAAAFASRVVHKLEETRARGERKRLMAAFKVAKQAGDEAELLQVMQQIKEIDDRRAGRGAAAAEAREQRDG